MVSFRPCQAPDCGNLVDKDSPRKFCSDACRQRSYRLRNAAKFSRHKEPRIVTCRYCGKRFCTTVASQRFCKASCRVASHQLQNRIALTIESENN